MPAPVAVIEAIDGADPFRARPVPGGLQHGQRVAMLAGQMQGDTQQRMGEGERGGIAECLGDREALLRIAERGVELSHPLVEDMHAAEQLELVRRVAARLGDRKAPAQGGTRRFAAAAREHQGQSERGLDVHFLGTAARGRIDCKQRPFRPAPAFDQQRHGEKDGSRRSSEV
ncbi:hypothetical protein ACVWWG_002354 [Bradyrhizobium sp. LB7.2]